MWVEHLREGTIGLEELLDEGQVICHLFFIGELACGNLKNTVEVLSLLQALPTVIGVEHEEVMQCKFRQENQTYRQSATVQT